MSLNGPAPEHLRPIRSYTAEQRAAQRQGASLRDKGAALAGANSEGWKDRALDALHALALTGDEVTANDLRAVMGDDTPHHVNAYGSVFLDAARRGWIENTGRVTTTTKAIGHAARITVWRSLIVPSQGVLL